MGGTNLNTPKEVGERVRRSRKALGLGQAELGALIGYSPNRISELERDGIDSLTLISKIAETLQISSTELLYNIPISIDFATLHSLEEEFTYLVDDTIEEFKKNTDKLMCMLQKNLKIKA